MPIKREKVEDAKATSSGNKERKKVEYNLCR
jgi:hypothetical protein